MPVDGPNTRLTSSSFWDDARMAFTLRELAGLTTAGHHLVDSVLVVIDAQQEYVTGRVALPGVEAAVTNIVRLLDAARNHQVPVIHVAHIGASGGPFDPAGPGVIIERVAPIAGESVVEKRLPNSFAGTDLDELIRATGRQTLVITGFMTHMCVSATARAAIDHGYDSTVVGDATGTRDLPSTGSTESITASVIHDAALAALADRFAAVVTTDALLAP